MRGGEDSDQSYQMYRRIVSMERGTSSLGAVSTGYNDVATLGDYDGTISADTVSDEGYKALLIVLAAIGISSASVCKLFICACCILAFTCQTQIGKGKKEL